MTSAPRSANIMEQTGPNCHMVQSSTRMPVRGAMLAQGRGLGVADGDQPGPAGVAEGGVRAVFSFALATIHY